MRDCKVIGENIDKIRKFFGNLLLSILPRGFGKSNDFPDL